MGLFANAFFDTIIFLVVLVVFTQIVVPLWRGTAWFPSVRKLRQLIERTDKNVR